MKRFRQLKKTENIRNMVSEITLDKNHLVYPLFIIEGNNIKEEIKSMPGQYRFSPDNLPGEMGDLQNLGIRNILLFGIPAKKDLSGREAYNSEGIIQKAVRQIKKEAPGITVITDVCLCEYTSHGHCGIINNGAVDNDKTLESLGKIALSHAESGADMIAPSDMMDGRIGYLREELDSNGFTDLPLMSYSIKYASSYYGPFREAAESAPEFGDRKSYQMDFRRKKEAFAKIETDIREGADIAIIKPALAYLDIIQQVSKKVSIPLAAYNVSGEYAMVKAAAANGWIDEKKIVIENMTAFKRAGADIIITYHAKDLASWLKK